ncbi:hypothetical protein PAXRUDRAFT_639634 [Paxillus rubicundulus Ve08.2h10]|uniref:Uncharacterized protein n=1 Tax=Paxillus rubicundulus Ve08.2h10 TaxID=930991 RepID=A0A0D0DSQ7_9AGAM|nr:hypothetical protein PAXRUDRAFT_639634 [Paxillus rubicundulus Ve08.2h10]
MIALYFALSQSWRALRRDRMVNAFTQLLVNQFRPRCVRLQNCCQALHWAASPPQVSTSTWILAVAWLTAIQVIFHLILGAPYRLLTWGRENCDVTPDLYQPRHLEHLALVVIIPSTEPETFVCKPSIGVHFAGTTCEYYLKPTSSFLDEITGVRTGVTKILERHLWEVIS